MLTYNDLITMDVDVDVFHVNDDTGAIDHYKCTSIFKCENDATCVLYDDLFHKTKCVSLYRISRIEGDEDFFLDLHKAIEYSRKLADERIQLAKMQYMSILNQHERFIDNFINKKQMCKCGRNDATAPHPCPYNEDIHGDSSTLCTCCDTCQQECVNYI